MKSFGGALALLAVDSSSAIGPPNAHTNETARAAPIIPSITP
jgi:hypothetical protein